MTARSCRSVLPKLVGGVAVIKVGAATETEMKEKKRVSRMLCMPRALLSRKASSPAAACRLFVPSRRSTSSRPTEEDEQIGVNIVRRALEEPLRCIAANAGQEGAVVVEKVAGGEGSFGFNAATEKYEDLVKAGVIDPAKVTRTALQNAASIAGLMLTTEAMIADIPDEKGDGGMGGMGGGMGGMGMGINSISQNSGSGSDRIPKSGLVTDGAFLLTRLHFRPTT